jgi:hypothetical protein
MSHGLRKLERHMQEGRLDRRGGIAKLWKRRVVEWASDSGGLACMTAREQTLLWHTAATSLLIDSVLHWAFLQPSLLDQNTELLNPLRKSLIAYLNAERRGLAALQLRPARPEALPTLSEYIAARSMPTSQSGPQAHQDGAGATISTNATTTSSDASDSPRGGGDSLVDANADKPIGRDV